MRIRVVVCVVVGLVGAVTIGACDRPSRGAPCKSDDDCRKADLKCVHTDQLMSFCTTTCVMGSADSCPAGWKCMDVSHFTDVHEYACVRR